MFNFPIGSFRNIQADKKTKKVAVEPIILRSPMGMCLNAQFPIVILAVPKKDLATSLRRFPSGKIGCFLKDENIVWLCKVYENMLYHIFPSSL